MADLQTIFNSCRELYKKCYGDVRLMSCEIAKYMESQGKNWDPRITVAKFDIVLQYSLLQVAVADFDFDRNEMIFIRDITEQGDFVNYINAMANTDITWDGLFNSSVSDIRKFLRDIKDVIEELSDEFVQVFALCDKLTQYDFVSDLEDNVVLIIAGLAKMDGTITASEITQTYLIMEAINRIKRLKR